MITNTILRLQFLLDTIPAKLADIREPDFSFKPSENKWSKKEALGHLIDSATNNHQRFVRVQFEDTPTIIYDQDNWNHFSFYNQMDGNHVIYFWATYNRHLLKLIKLIPKENLERTCRTNEPGPVTLKWLIDDYVVHMEHHLKQIVDY